MPESEEKRNGEISGSARRPEVIVEVLFERGVFHLAINNIGDAPAYNVSVKFDKELIGLGGSKDISTLPIFNNIEFLGPHREILVFVDTASSYFSRPQHVKIAANVSYKDSQNRRFQTTINHDLTIYRDLPFLEAGCEGRK